MRQGLQYFKGCLSLHGCLFRTSLALTLFFIFGVLLQEKLVVKGLLGNGGLLDNYFHHFLAHLYCVIVFLNWVINIPRLLLHRQILLIQIVSALLLPKEQPPLRQGNHVVGHAAVQVGCCEGVLDVGVHLQEFCDELQHLLRPESLFRLNILVYLPHKLVLHHHDQVNTSLTYLNIWSDLALHFYNKLHCPIYPFQ